MTVAFVRNHVAGTALKVAGTTVDLNISTIVPANNTIVAHILFDNAATASKPAVSSIAKAAGETANWVSLGAARSTSTTAGSFASGEMWIIKTTVDWPVAVYTVTLDTSTVMKATLAQEFSGLTAAPRSTGGTNYSTTTTAASAATTGTAPVIGDLAIGFMFQSNAAAFATSDTDTVGSAWSAIATFGSTGGNATTNNFGGAQYKILTSASAQTYNAAAALTAGNGAIVAVVQAVLDPLITQASYRFYADGTESASTALAAQDTTYTANMDAGDVNVLVRTRLQLTNAGVINATDDWQLQYLRGDFYDLSNASPGVHDLTNTQTQIAQSFTASGGPLTRATFYLTKTGTPTGTISAALWAHDGGAFGSTGLPTGSPLAISTTVLTASTVTGAVSAPSTHSFDFDGTFSPTPGTRYFIGLVTSGAAALGNNIGANVDSTAPTHPGNSALFTTVWNTNSTDLIFEVGTWTNVGSEVLADSYDETNFGSSAQQNVAGRFDGQSFLGNGQRLSRSGFWLNKTGAPTGNLTSYLYAHTGTFGSGLPTGSPLATSTTTVVANSLSTSSAWVYFTFDQTFTLVNGIPYFIVVGGASGDVSNNVGVGVDTTSPAHSGSYAFNTGAGWNPNAAVDTIFRAYTTPTTIAPFNSANLTDGAATTNRLGAGTGSFVAGKVSEDGLVDDLSWTANNYTELLYAVTIKAADLVNADTLRFRVLRNGARTGLTYTQTPTIPITKAAISGRPKVYIASAFAKKPAKVWSGAAWAEKPVKVWTGSAWKTLT